MSEKDPLELGAISREGVARTGNLKAAASAAASAKAPPPPKSKPSPAPQIAIPKKNVEMTVEQKSAYLDKITAYREKFPWLKKRNGSLSAKSADADLLDEMHHIEVQLGSKAASDSNVGITLFTTAMNGLEMSTQIFNPLNLKLGGLGKIATDNADQFSDVLDELVIKYTTGVYVSPEARLILGVGALVMTVHAANTGDPRVKAALERMNLAPKVSSAHSDL
jgi:hypothetical protein